MSKRNNRGRGRRQRPPAEVPRENETAEAVTAAWMLSVMTTLLCELGSTAARAYVEFVHPSVRVAMLSELLLFAAVVIGSASLLIFPVVLKTRRIPPPRTVSVASAIIAGAPLVVFAVRLLR